MPNKTVLITGAALRIGAAITRELHAAGMDVIIHYLNSRQPAESLAAELNAQRPDSAWTLSADLRDSTTLQALIEDAIACNGRLDALVNNASAFYPTPVAEVNETNWNDLMDVNLKAPMFLSQYASEELQRHAGCIINLTDIHGERPLKDHPVYSTAKAGLVMLTRALAKELAPAIRVNAISPGAVLWPESMDEATQQEILERIPLQRRGEPVEIARAVLYMIRDAHYVTGQVLTIDGGRTLYS